MSELSVWLEEKLRQRGWTQMQLAAYAGVGQSTVSGILNKEHIPKVETLFRLADTVGASRVQVLRLAGHLPRPGAGHSAEGDEEAVVEALLEEFRLLPEEWKPAVLEQMRQTRRMAEMQRVRVIGDEPAPGEEGEEPDGQTARSEAA